MIIVDCVQGTEEWFKIKAGLPSASNFDKIITTKGEPSKQSQKYLYQLAGEKITGLKDATFQSEAMDRGIELEAEARQFYEMVRDCKVDQVGLCIHDKKRYSCSPDGLVGEDGLLEIKCPLIATQVGYLLDGEVPTDYFQQVQGQLLVTGRKWCDFVSYYPGLKPLIVRVMPDPGFIQKLEIELETFCNRLEDVIKKIQWGDL